jgi:ABC-type lipoprotein export system ATPase subunit
MIKMIDDMTKNKTLVVITHDKEILEIMNKTINLHDMKKKKVEMVPVPAPYSESMIENFF